MSSLGRALQRWRAFLFTQSFVTNQFRQQPRVFLALPGVVRAHRVNKFAGDPRVDAPRWYKHSSRNECRLQSSAEDYSARCLPRSVGWSVPSQVAAHVHPGDGPNGYPDRHRSPWRSWLPDS